MDPVAQINDVLELVDRCIHSRVAACGALIRSEFVHPHGIALEKRDIDRDGLVVYGYGDRARTGTAPLVSRRRPASCT